MKFTENGSVTLRLGAARASAADPWLLSFEVEDTGPGISLKDQSRIFEPFVQAGKSSHPKGTGLGLAITRQFADMLGGSIRVRSALWRGLDLSTLKFLQFRGRRRRSRSPSFRASTSWKMASPMFAFLLLMTTSTIAACWSGCCGTPGSR